MDKLTFIMLCLISVFAGYISICRAQNSKGTFFYKWVCNTLFVLLYLNTISVYFGTVDSFLILTKDTEVFILQVFTAGLLAFLLRGNIINTFGTVWKSKGIDLPCVATIILVFSMIMMVVYKYMQYGNYSALFRALMPGSVCIALGCAFVVVMLIAAISKCIKGELFSFIRLNQWVPLAFVFTCSFYPFFETYVANRNEFTIDLSGVLLQVFIIAIFELLVVNLVVLFIGRKNQKMSYALLFSALISRYIQGMLLNESLFVMDGNGLDWGVGLIAINLAIWILILAINIVLQHKVKGYVKAIEYGAIAIIFIQAVGATSLLVGGTAATSSTGNYDEYLSTEGMYEVASGDNVIIFVLDTYDIDYIDNALAVDDDMLNELDGFTYYPDTVSQYSRTTPSLIYMLTDKEWYFDMPPASYADKSFEECSFWSDAVSKDFSLYFYEADTWMIGDTARKKASNYVEEGVLIDKKYSMLGCADAMRHINGYRGMPYIFKSYFNYTSTGVEEMVVDKLKWDKDPYVLDDALFYDNLKKTNISENDDINAIRVFHFNGAHAPFNLDRDGERVKKVDNNQVDQCIGSMKMVSDYIVKLKEAGVYDKCTIIITADHGENYVAEELPQTTNPILFIKPAYSIGDGYVISDSFASQNDIMSTVANIYGIDSGDLTGINLLKDNGFGRTRYHYYTVVRDSKQVQTRTYTVEGSSLDFNNWTPTDDYLDIYYINGEER